MIDTVINALQNALLQFQKDPWWELTAFIGEAMFGGRFIIQWIVSEYKKKSHIPIAFWYMSIIGTLILLAYSIHIEKPVLILAFTLQIGIYVRNLMLINRHKNVSAEPAT